VIIGSELLSTIWQAVIPDIDQSTSRPDGNSKKKSAELVGNTWLHLEFPLVPVIAGRIKSSVSPQSEMFYHVNSRCARTMKQHKTGEVQKIATPQSIAITISIFCPGASLSSTSNK
jgi:hypothetical protein